MNANPYLDKFAGILSLFMKLVSSLINPFNEFISDSHKSSTLLARSRAGAQIEMKVIPADHARLIRLPFNLAIKVGERPPLTIDLPALEVTHLVKPVQRWMRQSEQRHKKEVAEMWRK